MPRRYATRTRTRPRRVRRYVRRATVRRPMGKIMRAIRKVDRKGSQIIFLSNRVGPSSVGSLAGISNNNPYFYHPNNLQI